MTERLVAMGVDGAPGGWVAALLLRDDAGGTQRTELRLFSDIAALAADHEPGVVVGIDVPIGLLDRGPRACDREARRLLGPRAASVFPAPNRWMLDHASDYAGLRAHVSAQRVVGVELASLRPRGTASRGRSRRSTTGSRPTRRPTSGSWSAIRR